MSSKNHGFRRMYMITPDMHELLKNCIDQHEQRVLDNLNKDTTSLHDQSRTHTSSVVHDVSNRDISTIQSDLSGPSNPVVPHDELNISLPNESFVAPADTSYHRSIDRDRSRSFYDPNVSKASTRSILDASQISLPKDSSFHKSRTRSVLDESKMTLPRDSSFHLPPDSSFHEPNVSSRHNVSNKSLQVSLPDDSFSTSFHDPNISSKKNISNRSLHILPDDSFSNASLRHPSFGRLPTPDEGFFPKRTSSPIDRSALIPILPLPSCRKRPLPRSPIKTRIRTGALEYEPPPPKLPKNLKFICQYCNKHFARNWNLKKHVITIHRQEVPPDPDQPQNISNFKRKQQTHFVSPLFKSRKHDDFDHWQLENE